MRLITIALFVLAGTVSAFWMSPLDESAGLFMSPGAIYGYATVLFLPFVYYGEPSIFRHALARFIWVISAFASFQAALYTAIFLYQNNNNQDAWIVMATAGFVGASILVAGAYSILHLVKLEMQLLFALLVIVAGTLVPIITTALADLIDDTFLILFLAWQCAVSILLVFIVRKDSNKQNVH